MPYTTTRDLKLDVLHRVSEPSNSTDYSSKAIDYLNRTYRTLCAGASEFLPEVVDDWWWLRERATLSLLPAITTGTVTLVDGSADITFSDAPAASVVGYRIRVEGHPELFSVATHIAADTAATLDMPYNGPSATSAFKLMKVIYDLAANVNAIMGPMQGYRTNTRILGMSPERMDELYPMMNLNPGVPTAFSLEDEQQIRFNYGGRDDGRSMRVDYMFRPSVQELTDSDASIPLVPLEWRHILSDMATTYIFLDKNDDRSNAIALAARTGLAGMLRENKRQLKKMGAEGIGAIYPRQGGRYGNTPTGRGPLRTESGMIIG
jgi:hypothetical protein